MMDPELKTELVERFFKEIWPMNKNGNGEHAASELIHAIAKQQLFEGGPVTFEVIKEKYKEHLKYIRTINSSRDMQYHTKPDDIATFIMRKRFNEDFKLNTDNNLDEYLYGIEH